MKLRALMLGPVNSVHVEHMALAMRERGVDVVVGGVEWPGLAPGGLAEAGVPVETASGSLVLWLRHLRRRVRPHVVHAHWTPFAFKALMAGARPLIVTPWGSDVYRAGPAFRAANVPVARLAARVVSDSRDLLDAMVRLGARPERTVLLNWGVDLEAFTPPREPRAAVRARLALRPGPTVLSPRMLKPLYNPEAIVAACESVRARRPDLQLVLKHMATDAPEAVALARGDGVHVVGHVPYARMPDFYRAADVCVSIPDTDSSPRSVWEAMACGCPCVVSDLPWVHETLTPGEHALVVAPRQDEVAAAIEALLDDPGRAERLARAGRRLVESRRDRRREMDRLADVYAQVARRPER